MNLISKDSIIGKVVDWVRSEETEDESDSIDIGFDFDDSVENYDEPVNPEN